MVTFLKIEYEEQVNKKGGTRKARVFAEHTASLTEFFLHFRETVSLGLYLKSLTLHLSSTCHPTPPPLFHRFWSTSSTPTRLV